MKHAASRAERPEIQDGRDSRDEARVSMRMSSPQISHRTAGSRRKHVAPEVLAASLKRSRMLALTLVAALLAVALVSTMLILPHATGGNAAPSVVAQRSADTAATSQSATPAAGADGAEAASRSEVRDSITVKDEQKWESFDAATFDVKQLSKPQVNNQVIAKYMDRDGDAVPADFNPNHDTGDTGLKYAFSQCTWWAYLRRHELGLPAGSLMGNGNMWADSARALGYWVDRNPRVGDVVVFQAGQANADPVYGHVAIVEQVKDNGNKIVISETSASYNGVPGTRELGNVHDYEYVHY